MAEIFSISLVALIFSLLLGLIRILKGPSTTDRMMAAQLIGTAGVGMLLLLSFLFSQPALTDVALILALLAAVAVAAFTGRMQGDKL
jgi:multicomponent Na+:H+ antiporter subunit F